MLSEHTKRQFHQSRSTSDTSRLCHAPFISIYFKANGEMCLCADNQENVLGRYPQQSIQEAWSGAAAQAIRKQFQQNLIAEGCSKCAALLNVGDYASVPIRTFDQFMPGKSIPALFSSKEHHFLSPKIFVIGDEGRSASEGTESPYDKAFQLQLREWLPGLQVLKLETADALQIPLYKAICEDILSLQPKIKVHLRASDFVPQEKNISLLSSLKVEWKVSADRYLTISPASNQCMLDEKNLQASLATFRRVVQNKQLNCQLDLAISVSNFHLIGDVFNLCVRENLGFQWHIREEDEPSLMQLPRETLKVTFQQLGNTLKKARTSVKLSALQIQTFEALIRQFKYWWGETFRTKRFSDPTVQMDSLSVADFHFSGNESIELVTLLMAILKKDANKKDKQSDVLLKMLEEKFSQIDYAGIQLKSIEDSKKFNQQFMDIICLLDACKFKVEDSELKEKVKEISNVYNTDLMSDKLSKLFLSTPILVQLIHIKRLEKNQLITAMKSSFS